VTSGRARCQEHRAHGGVHGPLEVGQRQIDERSPLDVSMRDEVEGDVESSRLRGDGVGVLVDRAFVERVEVRRLGDSAYGANLVRDFFETGVIATGEKEMCPLPGKGARNGTADRSHAVDDGDLVVEQHQKPNLVAPYGSAVPKAYTVLGVIS
jgi:hypothetical protein